MATGVADDLVREDRADDDGDVVLDHRPVDPDIDRGRGGGTTAAVEPDPRLVTAYHRLRASVPDLVAALVEAVKRQ